MVLCFSLVIEDKINTVYANSVQNFNGVNKLNLGITVNFERPQFVL